jgi:hypothetical protein
MAVANAVFGRARTEIGAEEDAVIAARIGRTPTAVGVMWRKRKVPKIRDRRKQEGRQG